eukprot:3801885-Pleurochrysis_carterae.AAC.1
MVSCESGVVHHAISEGGRQLCRQYGERVGTHRRHRRRAVREQRQTRHMQRVGVACGDLLSVDRQMTKGVTNALPVQN